MANPSESDLIAAALDKLFSAAKPPPTVKGTLIELGADEAGDPAAFITVLLDDATRDKDWTSPKLEPIADAVRKAVRGVGVDRWPYVRFARMSDVGGPNANRPEWKAAG